MATAALLAAVVATSATSPTLTLTFHKPSLVGSSNYTHFWMPEPLFRAAAEPSAPLMVGIALHGDSGPWGKCPNPRHPQNCSAMYRSLSASADAWVQTDELPANALIQPTRANTSRGFSGKVEIDPTTNTSGTMSWKEWRWAAGTGISVVGGVGASAVTGLPPVYGTALSILASSVRLGDGSWLALAYGATQADAVAGSGNQTCVPMFHWQSHFCVSVFVLATVDEGRSWRYHSSLHWHPAMGTAVGGPSEAALTLLPDNRVLAVYRVEQHENLWQSLSGDGGATWGEPMQTSAWSVFPQLETLPNGATVLVSGRPGLGLFVLEDASTARWKLYNLAQAHNTACNSQCGINSTYDAYTAGIVNASTSVVNGRATHISAWRWTHPTTPPMTKAVHTQAPLIQNCSLVFKLNEVSEIDCLRCCLRFQYFGLEQGGCDAAGGSCDVLVSYDRDANGGEGPDCPMCKMHRVHGNEDKVFVMRVSVAK